MMAEKRIRGFLRRLLPLALALCLLAASAFAASYSKVYGKTEDKLRVRDQASASGKIVDNVVRDACIYITSSKTVGTKVWIQIKYRASDGTQQTGWMLQSDGNSRYVKVLTAAQAKSKYGVSDGSLPSKRVGTFTVSERTSGTTSSSSSSSTSSSVLKLNSSGTAVSALQKNLKTLGYYSADITGNFGTKTEAAVKKFQTKNGITADGIAGQKTLDAIEAGLLGSGSSSSGTSSSTATSSYGRVTVSKAKLRSSYSTSSDSKGSLTKGTVFTISKLYKVSGEKWYAVTVKLNGVSTNGYLRSDVMELISKSTYENGLDDDDDDDDDDDATVGMIRVTADNVYIRKSPSTAGVKVRMAKKGETYSYTKVSSGWYRLSSGYWISGAYVEVYSGSGSTGTKYQSGDEGAMITTIQTMLAKLGYYSGSISGHFGSKTKEAVEKFQKAVDVKSDGIVGSETLDLLMKAYEAKTDTSTASSIYATYGKSAYNVDWFTYKSSVYHAAGLRNGAKAVLVDLNTNIKLDVYVQSTGNHADVEPLTAADTAALCKIYGVSSASSINYKRRPAIVQVGGYQFVCSIYGTPHGEQDITDNNYSGQFCLHFRGSKTHSSDTVDSDHQEAIATAVTLLEKKGITVHTTAPSI